MNSCRRLKGIRKVVAVLCTGMLFAAPFGSCTAEDFSLDPLGIAEGAILSLSQSLVLTPVETAVDSLILIPINNYITNTITGFFEEMRDPR